MQNRKSEKLTVSKLLTRTDIQELIDDFTHNRMINADSLILIYKNKDEVNIRFTGLDSYLEVLGLLDIAKRIAIKLNAIDE